MREQQTSDTFQRLHSVLVVFLVLTLGACGSAQKTGPTDPAKPTATPMPVITYTPPAVPPDVQERGFNLIPASPDDYSSQDALHALYEMRSLGANAVTLTTTYNTDTLTSSTIHTGRYTASDNSLRTIIQEAQALGLRVNISVYVDSLTGEWRAHMAPRDRTIWFSEYGAILDHLATLSQEYGVHRLCLGVELISLSTATANPDNTAEWENLIRGVRSRYKGLIMYAANWGGSSSFGDEYAHIQFWKDVDVVGIDAYYPLGTSAHPTLAQMEHQWSVIQNTILAPFIKKVQHPLVFSEVGYRSIVGATILPNDSQSPGTYDDCTQANAYYALLDAWKHRALLSGIFWWYWETWPTSGGAGDTGFSPRFKSAAVYLTIFWGGIASDAVDKANALRRCGVPPPKLPQQ